MAFAPERFCNPATIEEVDLQKVMAPRSYRHSRNCIRANSIAGPLL